MNQLTIDEFKIKLGKRIQQLRISAGMTQPELAEKLGYKDRQVITRMETTGANLTAHNLLLMSVALDVSVEQLFVFDNL